MKKIIVSLFTYVLAATAYAEVIQIQNMSSILPYIKKDTLVVFDLDNTIMETPQMLGSDQWFDHAIEYKIKGGMDKGAALNTVADLWTVVQLKSDMQMVESKTASLIKNLQKKGVEVIALTARPEEMFDRTRAQLKKNKVVIKDIYSAGALTKGQAMTNIINAKYPKVTSVVFVDDKEKHAQTVNDALNLLSHITHFEFRYGFADAKVKAYDSKVADCQLQKFMNEQALVKDAECL